MRVHSRHLLTLAVTLSFGVGCTTDKSLSKPTIAIVTLMSHPALDALDSAMIGALLREGYKADSNLIVIRANAGGQQSAVAALVAQAIASKPDVLVAITTPVAQAAKSAFRGKIVFAAVTDPLSAGLVPSADSVFEGVTGSSDAFPFSEQLKLIRDLTPTVKTLGVIFNPGEAAATFGVNEIKKAAPDLGFTVREAPVSSSTEIYARAQSEARSVDAFLITSDNTTISGIAAVIRAASPRKLPVYAGESGSVSKGALATASVSYTNLGSQTGTLIARMIRGETRIPIVVGREADVVLNRRMATILGITVPPNVASRVSMYVDSIR